MTQPDPIVIPTETYSRVAPIVAQSALRNCTDVTIDAYSVIVTRRWPSLSTGEQILWDLLESLVAGELSRALHLDDHNRALVADAITRTYCAERGTEVAA